MPQHLREMVFDRELGKLRPVCSNAQPVLSSSSLKWSGYLLEQHHVASVDPSEVTWMNNVVVLQLERPFHMEWKDRGRYVPKTIAPGQVSILPAGCATSVRSGEGADFLSVSLSPTFMTMACGEFVTSPDFEMRMEFGREDKFIEGVCLALRDEVTKGGPSGKNYTESLASSLAVHLAQNYGHRDGQTRTGTVGVSSRRIRQAMEFINERLGQDISLKEIAQSVNLSQFHFARLFKESVGLSPHQFVIKQRIERAKRLLLQGDSPIATIAVDVGFADQSHFTSQFRKRCGLTPQDFVNRARGKTKD